jgi:TRAP-type C4-dicarboxylate transport system substrate-binding protein
MTKRILFILLAVVLALSVGIMGCNGQQEEEEPVVLQFATIDAQGAFTAQATQAFADELKLRTNGEYEVEIIWGAAAGPMDQHYELVKTGVVDAGFFLPTITPGVFPLTEHLSFLPWTVPDFETSVWSIWKAYEQGLFDEELSDVKVFAAWHGTGQTLFMEEELENLWDIAGLTIGAEGSAAFDVIEAWDAVPEETHLDEHYTKLTTGITDGAYLVWVAVTPFNVYPPAANYAYEPLFGNPTCIWAFNLDSWNALPTSVQDIILDLSEDTILPAIVDGYEQVDTAGREKFTDEGGVIRDFTEDEMAWFEERVEPLWDGWVADLGQENIDAFWNILHDMGIENPAIGYSPAA